MFHIFITGQLRNKRKIEDFCYDVLDYFFYKSVLEPVDIELRVSKYCQTMGGCYGDNCNIVIEHAKGFDDEQGNYVPYMENEIVTTLAHELVHAKQLIREQKYPITDGAARSLMEKEAYDLESFLVEMFWN